MNVLLTSGAAYTAPGLLAMRQALIESGFNVLTVAPAVEQEHAAQSLTARSSITVARAGGDEKNPIYKVDSTPVDCVRVAVLSGLARDVSVVVSGACDNLCLGEQSYYSGTASAAKEAANLGYPAVAIFQQVIEGVSVDYHWATVVAGEVAAWFGASSTPMSCAISINVPAKIQSRHLKLATPAQRVWDPSEIGQAFTDEALDAVTFKRLPYQSPQYEMEAGSDATVVSTGHVALTPLNCVSGKTIDDDMRHRLSEVIDNTNLRVGATPQACRAGCCG